MEKEQEVCMREMWFNTDILSIAQIEIKIDNRINKSKPPTTAIVNGCVKQLS